MAYGKMRCVIDSNIFSDVIDKQLHFSVGGCFFNSWARLLKIRKTLIQDQKLNEDCISAFVDHVFKSLFKAVAKSQLYRIMGKIVWKTFIYTLQAFQSIC